LRPLQCAHGVYDRGVPNQERIVLRARSAFDAGQFAIGLGVHQATYLDFPIAVPIPDQFLWFGNANVEAGAWIFLYTGAGEPRKTTVSGTSVPAYVIYWNKATTVLANSSVVPILFRLAGVQVMQPPENQIQPSLFGTAPVKAVAGKSRS
jgi:hypothetical protein